ncbi:ribose-phosphate pyrophosphokinase-like domain-containing protein [uncultured Marinobacter sp.]|uniref:ribose-phosphate pyrophosphokinase-like domain-containing protein n=1 Tax=uncultured Marinobacter sp. TaxID=187379 RepID=UPI002587D460|nr:ribose-phosphate pyrophosphokinase-like domain-containing protein [uncultured Marinobacter sp.]
MIVGITEESVLFSLAPHPLREKLCDRLNLEPGSLEVRRFPDGESYLRVLTSVKGANCVILADLTHPDTKYLGCQFIWIAPWRLMFLRFTAATKISIG